MIGQYLKKAREEKGITQEFVAKEMYISRQTLSRWEQGKTLPNIYSLQKLSSIYNVPLDALIEGANGKTENEENKRINYFALFGALLFNLLLFSIILFISIISIISLWSLAIICTISPIIFVIFVSLNLQNFEAIQLLVSITFSVIGVILLVISKRVTIFLYNYFKIYLKYNHKTIFY